MDIKDILKGVGATIGGFAVMVGLCVMGTEEFADALLSILTQ